MRRMTVYEAPEHHMGGEIYYREEPFAHDPELHKAYKCGVKQGWREAMIETARGDYNERRDWREMPPLMREHDRYGDKPRYREDYDDDYSERRHRDSRGRYM